MATAVFAVGVAALAPLAVNQLRATDTSQLRTEAVALAQEKIEEFRSLPFAAVSTTGTGSETVGVFQRRWQVTLPPGPAVDTADMRRIAVTVSWGQPDRPLPGRPGGSVSLVTARGGY